MSQNLTSPPTKKPVSIFQAILITTLVAGTLDGLAAVVQYLLKGGKHPEAIFRYIASGVFGKSALTGGASMVIAGILFHYLIAFLMTVLFFLMYRWIQRLNFNKILVGVMYGMLVWMIMNLVVVPLSHTPPIPLTPSRVVVSMLILIFMIGLPISLLANRLMTQHEKNGLNV